ncbi:MAG TPA: tRNA preQ1(34) S-adenosylmethionine ribosyltransferase-isomerase QueA [Synergistetes bacterium]|nr:tRNA preQ1(34) S-adenosylmethionine ribosyltransferase-isomerase QueA [Synergistota bacterium]
MKENRSAGQDPRFFDAASYDYILPGELIAQYPVEPRDSSRLLVVDRSSGEIAHRSFQDIVSCLRKGDIMILNDTRVIRARLRGRKEGGEALIEIFLLKPVSQPDSGEIAWEALVRPGKRVKPGKRVILNGNVPVTVMGEGRDGTRICCFPDGLDVMSYIDKNGEIPLPPYIHNPFIDPERYQTVYSRSTGSVAAPTAGLHFTRRLLSKIDGLGVLRKNITLNVGLGTFRPVKVSDIRDHVMHREEGFIPEETASEIMNKRNSGGRVVAVGTTAVRALESRTLEKGVLEAGPFSTDAFFYPGYSFRMVDVMITNFHLPKSTLLMLVAAFAGLELTMKAYREAVAKKYRFYSFGDSMLIL